MSTIISSAVTALDEKLKSQPPEVVEKLEATATLDSSEWVFFGDKPSLLLAQGLLPADEAQRLHAIHTTFQTTATLAERIVFLQAMQELLAP